jgi:predicted nucleotidyltransferase
MAEIKQKIIELLADYPEREFYAQEIVKKVGCSKASASGILKFLADKKIVSKKVKGHMKFYQINQGSSEVKRLRIDLALEKLAATVLKLKKFSQKIILFGSASRGEQTFGSDIDLFILTNNKKEIQDNLKKVSSKLKINAIVKTPSEWSEMEVTSPEFYQEVKNGITLYNYVPRI